MKNKKRILISSISSAAIVTSIVAPLCAINAKVDTNKVATTKSTSTSNATYTTIKFTLGETYKDTATITGATSVKGKVGRPFSTIVAPKVAHNNNWKFLGWSTDGTEANIVKSSTPIPKEGMTLAPLFEEPTALTKCFGVSAIEDTKVSIIRVGNASPNLQYTIDFGQSWQTVSWAANDIEVTVTGGNTIYFKGTNTGGFSTSASDYIHFKFDQHVNIFGNAMALVNGGKTVDKKTDVVPNAYCFYHLFALEDGDEAKYKTSIRNVADNFLPCEGVTGTTIVLKDYCYAGMFKNCQSIEHAPRLFATNESVAAAQHCYEEIFSGCSSVNYIRTRYTGNFDESTGQFTNWVKGVSSSADSMIVYDGSSTTTGDSKLPTNWKVSKTAQSVSVVSVENTTDFIADHDYELKATCYSSGGTTPTVDQNVYWTSDKPNVASIDHTKGIVHTYPVKTTTTVKIYCYSRANLNANTLANPLTITVNPIQEANIAKITAVDSAAQLTWSFVGEGIGTEKITPKFRYSTDKGTTWYDFDSGKVIDIPLSTEDEESYLLVKGDNKLGLSAGTDTSYTNFKTPIGKISISGDIRGLIFDGRTDKSNEAIPCNYCFANLFDGTNIKTITNPTTFLSFTGLTPYCYSGMFRSCKYLTTTLTLPATTLTEDCYEYMFYGCSALQTPPVLGATTLQPYCYLCMFYNCTNLKSTPALPATAATEGCYYMMFQYCTNITTFNKISLESLADYACYQMFAGMLDAHPSMFAIGSSTNYFFKCPSTTNLTDPVTRMLFIYDGSLNPPGYREPKTGEYIKKAS